MLLLIDLIRLMLEKDVSLLEINPLVVTKDSKLIAVDAKITFDDSALIRQPYIAALEDPEQADELELEAQKAGLNYVRLNGTVVDSNRFVATTQPCVTVTTLNRRTQTANTYTVADWRARNGNQIPMRQRMDRNKVHVTAACSEVRAAALL